MTYKAISNPLWKLKDEFNHLLLPKHVSAHGSLPSHRRCYELIHRPSMEINDRGRITYSNYFGGKILQTLEDAQAWAEKLNNKN
jgi:hypothetical protein